MVVGFGVRVRVLLQVEVLGFDISWLVSGLELGWMLINVCSVHEQNMISIFTLSRCRPRVSLQRGPHSAAGTVWFFTGSLDS